MADSREEVFPITKESIDNEDEDFVPSFKIFGKLRFLPQKPLDASEATCWKLQYLKLEMLSAVRELSRKLPKMWVENL